MASEKDAIGGGPTAFSSGSTKPRRSLTALGSSLAVHLGAVRREACISPADAL
jgi:hypothetical protein